MEEELYYPSSEIKNADQLCSYCTADLRLCFSQMQIIVGFLVQWLKCKRSQIDLNNTEEQKRVCHVLIQGAPETCIAAKYGTNLRLSL